MTIINLDTYLLEQLMELKEGEVQEVYDQNGTYGYFEKDTTGDIVIFGRHYTFNYFQPNKVVVRMYIDNNYQNTKRIGGN